LYNRLFIYRMCSRIILPSIRLYCKSSLFIWGRT